VYSTTPEGLNALAFAVSLYRLVGEGQLQLYLGTDAKAASLAVSGTDCADAIQKERVIKDVSAVTKLPQESINLVSFPQDGSPIPFPTGAIVVDNGRQHERHDINVLVPFDEKALDSRGTGPILIPFGDGESGKVAALLGLRLAIKLKREVVFYHTTWRANVDSEDPADHLCAEAREVRAQLESWARNAGVAFQTRIEMAPDVTEGILHAAVDAAVDAAVEPAGDLSASLIVTSRGRKTKIGSYVDQLLNESPFPLLIVSRHSASLLTPPVGGKRLPAAGPTALKEEGERPGGFRRALQWLTSRVDWAVDQGERFMDSLVARLPQGMQQRIGNPIFVMQVVMAMYILKFAVKFSLGLLINSPVLTGDGLHNLSDLLEAGMVIVLIKLAQRPPNERYAYGRKNIEYFYQGAIGIGLIGMSVFFLMKSASGILSYFPAADGMLRPFLPFLPSHEPLIMSAAHFPFVLVATAGSVVLSLAVSRYQINVGSRTGHDSLVADGEETKSDGRIEFVTLVGVLAEYLFHAPWIEYPLGVLIAVLIARTGRELLVQAYHVLLQHTIGVEHDAKVREILEKTRGIHRATEVKSFQVGRIAVYHLAVTTLRTAQTVVHIKYAVKRAVEQYVLKQDFMRCEAHINFQAPEPRRHRQAIAIVRSGDAVAVAPSIESATSIMVCDLEFGAIKRATEEEPTADPIALLVHKRVNMIYQFGIQTAHAAALSAAHIELRQAPSYLPQVLGLSRQAMDEGLVSA